MLIVLSKIYQTYVFFFHKIKKFQNGRKTTVIIIFIFIPISCLCYFIVLCLSCCGYLVLSAVALCCLPFTEAQTMYSNVLQLISSSLLVNTSSLVMLSFDQLLIQVSVPYLTLYKSDLLLIYRLMFSKYIVIALHV